jgi:hypothetical protein
MTFFELALSRLLIYFLAYLLALPIGHFVVRQVVLRKYQPKEAGGLKGAGSTIGYLERLLTLTFVLLAQYEALALIFAAKSIARFQELKQREFAEYYLLGTLSSILFAMLIGIFASWLLSLL